MEMDVLGFLCFFIYLRVLSAVLNRLYTEKKRD